MGGKASLTTSTEDGHWRASLDIQTNLSTDAQPGQASTSTPYSAAPGQDGAPAAPDDAGAPPRLFGPKHVLGLTRRPWLPEKEAPPCQALATRVQAVPPPPPPPPSNSARLIKVLKRPVGTQLRFSNLDGVRASVSSEDRLSTSFERQEEGVDGEEEEDKEEEEEETW